MVKGILIFVMFALLSTTIALGVKWRKEPINLMKEIIKSKQNICMGVMLIVTAIFFFISSTTFGVMVIISFILLALGTFNTYQGVRMYQHYNKQLQASTKN